MNVRALRLIVLVTACGLLLGAAVAQAKRPPRKATTVIAQGYLSPLQDQVQFYAGATSKARGCSLRPVTILRPLSGTVLATIKTVSPSRSGSRWTGEDFSEFRPIAGYVTPGETLQATTGVKKLRRQGRVKTVCKADSYTFKVPEE